MTRFNRHPWIRPAMFVAAVALCVGGSGTSCPPTNVMCVPTLTGGPAILADDHIFGDPNAPLTVIEYADFQCPFCGRFARESYPAIKAEFIDTGKVRFIFRHFPLRSIHAHAEHAAQASECANGQGKFEVYHDEVYNSLANLNATQTNDALTDQKLQEYASNVMVDRNAFDPCLANGNSAARVQENVDSGNALQVSSTPTFFVAAQKVEGFKTAAEFATILHNHLCDQQ